MAEISIQDFAGTPAPSAAPVAAPSKPTSQPAGEISVEEFSGGKPQPESPGFAGQAVGTVAQFSDMFTGIGKQLLGSAVYWGANTAVLAKGEDQRTAATAAQLTKDYFFPEEISAPWGKVAETLGPETKAFYDHNPLAWVMTKINEIVTGGVDKAAAGTGMPPEHFAALADQLMGSIGWKAVKAPIAKALKARLTDAGVKPGEAAGLEAPHYEPSPEVAEAIASVTKPRIKGPPAVMREVTPEEFRGEAPAEPQPHPDTAAQETSYSERPGGTVVGQWEGPGGEFTETGEKPGLGERAKALVFDDRRWYARLPKDQSGKADPATLAAIAAAGGFAAWAAANPDRAKEIGLGGLLIAGAVKGKGGMWHPEVVERLAKPLELRLAGIRGDVADPIYEGVRATRDSPAANWADRAVRNYLNKYAGTEGDPLKEVEIPHGRGTLPWGTIADRAIVSRPARDYPGYGQRPGVLEGTPAMELVFTLGGNAGIDATNSITNYLSHVGDYLRQKVDPAKLPQYDLVRAVKETAKWDAELAAKMNSVEGRMEGTVPFKTYPDKFQWVEVKSAEALKREGDMMGHCVGGYCDYVASGETKIYSLRDPKGGSHVTVEVEPSGSKVPIYDANGRPTGQFSEGLPTSNISQIKGKQNRAPAPEYLPYVQDFVKSGKWGEVGDINNAGLRDIRRVVGQGGQHLGGEGFFGQRYVTPEAANEFARGNRSHALKEKGSIDPKLLSRMALVGGGAAVGAALNEDSPVLGGLVGAVAGAFAPRALRATGAAGGQLVKGEFRAAAKELVPGPISKAFAVDKDRASIEKEMNAAELFTRRSELARSRLVNQVVTLVPDPKGRERIAHSLEGDTRITLTPKEAQAAQAMKRFFGEQGTAGLDAGVLKDTIENYVTHVFGREGLPLIDAFFAQRASGSASTPFAKARTGPPTIAEVNAWMAKNGKPPITADVAKIAEIYGRSLTRAIANKSVLDALKIRTTRILSGGKDVERPLIMRPGKAPGTYEHVGRTGYVAHPDIVPALKFIFSHDDAPSFVRGIEALNTAAKRSAVMLSLFHAKNLIDAFAGASKLQPGKIAAGAAIGGVFGATQDDPVTYAMIGAGLGMAYPGAKIAAQAALPKVFGENAYVKALRQHDPALAKMIDLSFQGGLEYSLKGGGLAVEDVGGAFYQGMQMLQAELDRVMPPAASAIRGLEKVNHAMDGFLWERLHTGMKLSIFAEKYETLLQNNAAAHAKNPRVELMSEERLAQIAASYTNDIFGGLNWRRVAAEAKTKWGAALAQGAYSPTGRRVLQLLMFAPDWTIATTRSAMKAAGTWVGQEKGTGWRGVLRPQTVADLHRQYMLRSALYYVMIGDGLNMALSGHHIWENKDPTYIELADGRKMQFSKHTMEPYHWLLNPVQQGLNKFGQVPKEALNQIFGTEYLAPRTERTGQVAAGPKMQGSRLSHVARTLNPIGAKQFVEGGGSGVLGSLGMPVYGKTKAERERIRQQRALDRALRGR